MTIEKPETQFEEPMDRFYTDPVWEELPSMVDNSPLGQRWEVVLLLQRLDTQLDEGIWADLKKLFRQLLGTIQIGKIM